MTDSTIFTASAESRLLTQEMAKIAVGEIITYERIESIIGISIKDKPSSLRTALKRALRDHNMVFGCVPTVGYKRLDDLGIIQEAAHAANVIRHRAHRSIERQSKVAFDKLSGADQMRFSAQTAIMGAIAMMSRSSSVSKIESKMGSGRKELPTAETLRMFLSHGTASEQAPEAA